MGPRYAPWRRSWWSAWITAASICPKVVESAAGDFPFDRDILTELLLRYNFAPSHRQGLRRFYELARAPGELDEVLELRFHHEFAAADIPAVLDDANPGDAVPEETGAAAVTAGTPGAAS